MMTFAASDLPRYIVIAPADRKMKDIIGYNNEHLTTKIPDRKDRIP